MATRYAPPQPTVASRIGRWAALIGSLALFAGSAHAQATQLAPYKVIVNASNPVTWVKKSELAAMFLKKADSWPTGALVVPVDQPERAAVRQSFSRDVIGKPPAAVKSYWNQLVFSGRSVPPPEKLTDDEVINFVKNTPSAVGYISATTKSKGVKVLVVRS
jgi:ABC-type phosphate transport system substrate-binding protein